MIPKIIKKLLKIYKTIRIVWKPLETIRKQMKIIGHWKPLETIRKQMKTIETQPDDSQTTARRQPDDSGFPADLQPDDNPTTARRQPNDTQTTARRQPDDTLTTTRRQRILCGIASQHEIVPVNLRQSQSTWNWASQLETGGKIQTQMPKRNFCVNV